MEELKIKQLSHIFLIQNFIFNFFFFFFHMCELYCVCACVCEYEIYSTKCSLKHNQTTTLAPGAFKGTGGWG